AGEDPDRWMMLIAPQPSEALKAQLRALLQVERDRKAGQSADAGPADRKDRVAALRKELAAHDLHGFIVPRADEHQGEYVPPRAERLAWLTGFTGSAGLAIVLPQRAAIFVDGRYTLQVRAQADASLFELLHSTNDPAEAWVEASLKPGQRLAYDPWLHTPDGLTRLRQAAAPARGEGGRRPRPLRHHPGRRRVEGSAPAADLARGGARGALHRPEQRRQAPASRQVAGRARPRCGGADRTRLDRLAAQHPRR